MPFFAAVDDVVKGLREYLVEVGECGTDGSFEPFILHITAIFPPCQDRLGTSMRGKALKKEMGVLRWERTYWVFTSEHGYNLGCGIVSFEREFMDWSTET
jgi:hypothetical protein